MKINFQPSIPRVWIYHILVVILKNEWQSISTFDKKSRGEQQSLRRSKWKRMTQQPLESHLQLYFMATKRAKKMTDVLIKPQVTIWNQWLKWPTYLKFIPFWGSAVAAFDSLQHPTSAPLIKKMVAVMRLKANNTKTKCLRKWWIATHLCHQNRFLPPLFLCWFCLVSPFSDSLGLHLPQLILLHF